MTQTQHIVEILKRDGQIDNFYAITNKITLRLAARIGELREQGWNILTEKRQDKNTVYVALNQPRSIQQITRPFTHLKFKM